MPNTVVKMPQLGESVSEGTIGRWLKNPGDRVELDEPLVEIQTDKVNAEVPSPVAGILQQILLPEGTTAAVTSDMAIIGDEVSAPSPSAAPAPVESRGAQEPAAQPTAMAAGSADRPRTFTYDQTAGGGVVGTRDADDQPRPDSAGPEPEVKRFYTPVVLRMAEEHAIDLATIQGTGAHGRVTRKDVERAIADPQAHRAAATAPPGGGPAPAPTTAPTTPSAAGPATTSSAAGHGATSPAAGHAATSSAAGHGATSPAAGDGATSSAAGHGATSPAAGDAATSSAAGHGATSPAAGHAATSPAAGLAAGAGATTVGADGLGAAALRGTLEGPSGPRATETAPAAEDRPLTPMRRAIAEHMSRARAEVPDAWALVEIDLTNLVRQRERVQPAWQAREGYELTYLPFFIKAVVAALQVVPELNAAWAGDHVRVFREHHLGIAVSLENGLVVPVLRDADQLSVSGIARALRHIVQKARGGKLSLDDLQGATFTVNNPGSLGSIMSQPIVPVGQAGIVTMEAIVKRAVVVADDAIAVRSMMNCCLSFDHRVLDGAGALKFLRELKHQLEALEYPLY